MAFSTSLFKRSSSADSDSCAAALARENLADNGLAGEILTGDWGALDLPGADLVIANPPWYPAGQRGDAAHVEGRSLDELCRSAAKPLGHRGRFALVYPPGRLVELLCALRGAGLEPKRLGLCRHRADKAPYAALIEAVKGGRPGLDILPDRLS